MEPNPYDPRQRNDLTENEKTVLRFMDEIMHGDITQRTARFDLRQVQDVVHQGEQLVHPGLNPAEHRIEFLILLVHIPQRGRQ